jgi:hypothetical protein
MNTIIFYVFIKSEASLENALHATVSGEDWSSDLFRLDIN